MTTSINHICIICHTNNTFTTVFIIAIIIAFCGIINMNRYSEEKLSQLIKMQQMNMQTNNNNKKLLIYLIIFIVLCITIVLSVNIYFDRSEAITDKNITIRNEKNRNRKFK